MVHKWFIKWRIICTSLVLLWLVIGSVQAQAAPSNDTPRRIVSLTPHITEMLFAIGAGPQVVGVDSASDYPVEVLKLPKVANYQSLNLESLLQLKPDLVIGWDSTQSRLKPQLEQFHIPLVLLHSQHLTDLPKELRQLGSLTGHDEQAKELAHQLEQRFQYYAQQAAQRKTKISVFYQLWYAPLMTVAKGSYIEEILELCGAENPFANSPVAYPQVSAEAVIAANPEIIFATKHGQHLEEWLKWPSLRAVQQHRLYLLNADWLHRLSPRIILGIEQVCRDTLPQPSQSSPKHALE